MNRFIDLVGLKSRADGVHRELDMKYIVKHDDINTYGNGIAQRIIEKYRKKHE